MGYDVPIQVGGDSPLTRPGYTWAVRIEKKDRLPSEKRHSVPTRAVDGMVTQCPLTFITPFEVHDDLPTKCRLCRARAVTGSPNG